MNKTDLIAAVAEKTGMSKKQTGEIIDATISTLTDALKTGQDITLSGFGTFNSVTRAPRIGRNPHTGEAVDIPACRKARFKPGKMLKDALANEGHHDCE